MGYKVKRILVGTNQVRPSGGQPRTPTSNTIAYYKFNNNLNDSSGNSRNYTIATGTPTYGTIGNNHYVQYTNSFYTNRLDYSGTNQMTISCWICGTANAGNGWGVILDISTTASSGELFRCWCNDGNFGVWGTENIPNCYSPQQTWANFVITFNGSTHLIYMNGVYQGVSSRATTSRTIQSKINNVRDISGSGYNGNAKISELIVDGVLWSATDIANYYNGTKSNYGL